MAQTKPMPQALNGALMTDQPVAIQVLERAMRLLDALAHQSDPVALKDLAKSTGLHTSTTHRILNDLVAGRYVERVDSGMYRLGMRLLELGSLVKGRLDVREVAIEPMRQLHKLTGQTINLSLQQGDEIVYIERAWSECSGMQVVRAIGGRAPLHLTSTGKLFLSVSDPRQVRAYAMRTGSCAQAMAVFIKTPSQPSSIAIVASEAVPTPASTITGTLLCSMINDRFQGFKMPMPEPISEASGMMAAQPMSSSMRA